MGEVHTPAETLRIGGTAEVPLEKGRLEVYKIAQSVYLIKSQSRNPELVVKTASAFT